MQIHEPVETRDAFLVGYLSLAAGCALSLPSLTALARIGASDALVARLDELAARVTTSIEEGRLHVGAVRQRLERYGLQLDDCQNATKRDYDAWRTRCAQTFERLLDEARWSHVTNGDPHYETYSLRNAAAVVAHDLGLAIGGTEQTLGRVMWLEDWLAVDREHAKIPAIVTATRQALAEYIRKLAVKTDDPLAHRLLGTSWCETTSNLTRAVTEQPVSEAHRLVRAGARTVEQLLPAG